MSSSSSSASSPASDTTAAAPGVTPGAAVANGTRSRQASGRTPIPRTRDGQARSTARKAPSPDSDDTIPDPALQLVEDADARNRKRHIEQEALAKERAKRRKVQQEEEARWRREAEEKAVRAVDEEEAAEAARREARRDEAKRTGDMERMLWSQGVGKDEADAGALEPEPGPFARRSRSEGSAAQEEKAGPSVQLREHDRMEELERLLTGVAASVKAISGDLRIVDQRAKRGRLNWNMTAHVLDAQALPRVILEAVSGYPPPLIVSCLYACAAPA